MALDAANVRVGITGGVRSAPVGTTAPTNPTDAYGVGWNEYGYVGEDGVEETFTSESTDIRAWQNGVLVRTVNSKTDAMFKFMVIETNKTILADFRPGSSVSTNTGITTTVVKPISPNPKAFSIDVIDGAYNTRKIIPRGEIVDRGPITYKTDEAIGYEITIKAYPASDGTLYIEYSNDPAVAVS